MPIFEYKCSGCGHTMEMLQKSSKAANPTCEQCGSEDVQKLFSGFAVGRGENAARSCDTCDGGPCFGNPCPTGTCPID
jgi:putative FmdB family regulatory protein